jgi:hypothetical protein
MWAHISTLHPNFPQYFILLVPFLGILASVGLYSIGSQMYHPDRPLWPLLVYGVLLSLGLSKSVYEERDDFTWRDFEGIARKVDQVTPPNAPLLADEHVYFLTRRPPPSGMELRDSHKLELPADSMHAFLKGLDRRTAGVFTTVKLAGLAMIEALGLRATLPKSRNADCSIFWDRGYSLRNFPIYQKLRVVSATRHHSKGCYRVLVLGKITKLHSVTKLAKQTAC